MSIKVQVKDNRGCTSTFTDRLNGSFVADGCTTNFATGTANCGIGVTPINATNGNWNAAYGQPMNVNTFDAATPFAAYSQPMTLGLSGQLAGQYATFAKPFGPAIQGGLPMTAGFNGMNISLVHTFIGRSDVRLDTCHTARQLPLDRIQDAPSGQPRPRVGSQDRQACHRESP